MINIVPVKLKANIGVVADLAKIIWTEHYTPIIGLEQVNYMLDKFQSENAIQEQLEKGIAYYLLQFKDEFVGYFSYSINEDALFLSKLYVLKSARGNGVAKVGLSFMQSQAKELNLAKIRLTVNKYNSDSIAAYEKMGFLNVDSIVQDIGGGYVMDDYVLERKLD
ncbi:GNAT family N-acetyltransferase [Muricauda sp. MAR_2010_75]|uniref:GNAT family N-acetyltransferase n=1 Tax=Allomuricauda sp. MAR_2010_75 TaxID=1250232 RepID=UPI0005659B09|nr:GNAT family N-acetyltransferase [Muricauda sp. MAR_2010_75]